MITKIERTRAFAAAVDAAKYVRKSTEVAGRVGNRIYRELIRRYESNHPDILGAIDEHLSSVAGELAELMAVTSMRGCLRALAEVIPHIPIAASYKREIRSLLRMVYSDINPDTLVEIWQQQAAGIINELSKSLRQVVSKDLVGLIGVPTREGVKILRESLQDAGIMMPNAWAIETIFRTQAMLAYEAGQGLIDHDPDIQDILWGYKYVTIGDDRVRPNHRLLEGTTAPKEDPIWRSIKPPNGWACRCRVIRLFGPRKIVKPHGPIEKDGKTIRPEPDTGWHWDPSRALVEVLGPVRISRLKSISKTAVKVGLLPGANAAAIEARRKALFPPDDETRCVLSELSTQEQAALTEDYKDEIEWFTNLEQELEYTEEGYRMLFAVRDYSGTGYRPMNSVARRIPPAVDIQQMDVEAIESIAGQFAGDVSPGTLASRIVDLDRLVKKARPLRKSRVLLRVQTYDPEWKVGQERMLAGFTSFSNAYLGAFVPVGPDAVPILIEAYAPAGSRGILAGFNDFEQEFIVGHGKRFRVLGVRDVKLNYAGRLMDSKAYQIELLDD